MKKLTLLIVCSIISLIGFSQKIYKTTSGEISFFSTTPVEDIDAVNKKVKGIINTETKEIAFVSTIIGFEFKKPLMGEHFNENYMESDKYKTSVYKGKMYGDIDFKKDGKYPVTSKGTLKMHGVEKEREIKGIITIKGGKISLKSEFDVKLSDHNIKIPKMVMKKIAETVKVTVNMSFEPKK